MIVADAPQAAWLAALQRVLGIVGRRHTLPILANVLIRKSGPSIEFTTHDLALQLRTRAELGGDAGDFATTMNARKLADILHAMPPDQRVRLSAAGDTLTLRGGRSRFRLQTLPAQDFPLVQPVAAAEPAFELPQAVLKSLIAQVGFAMAVQDIRYFLNGVLFITEGTRLTLVATDGNRLALAGATLAHALPRQQVILPRKAVLALQPLLQGRDDAAVQIRFAAAQAVFTFDGTEFTTQLVEGRFPDYRRVVPQGHRHTLTLGRAPLLAGLQRAAILTSEKFRGVRLQLAPGALRITASNAQHEEADEDIAVDYDGEAMEIGFNVGYLMDALTHADDETVRVELHDAQSSVRFSFPERTGFQYVVSPMRL